MKKLKDKIMNNIDKQYQRLLQDIIHNGVEKKDRTGTGTISVFGRQIRHKMSEGFPLLTTKKMAWKSIVTELLWFLRGDTNIKYLVDNGCHIWDGDVHKNYVSNHEKHEWTDAFCRQNLKDCGDQWDIFDKEEFINKIKTDDEFAKKWGELGPIYGKQWRSWGMFAPFHTVKGIDQIANLISELKTNPDSRRLMVNAWNVGELDQMVLPPCHYGFQVYTRELSREERWDLYSNRYAQMKPYKFQKMLDGIWVESTEEEDMFEYDVFRIPKRAISLMWNQRSVDTFLGLPFNIASYGLLLEIIAKEVNMVPNELIGNLGDVHLYSNHKEQAVEQIGRTPFELPTITITENNWYLHEKVKEHLGEKTFTEKIESYNLDCFTLNNYQSHQSIKAPLSN
jgi:thymidylate synthase